MDPFLSEYMRSLTETGQRKVGYILEAAKVNKNKLDTLSARINNTELYSYIVLQEHLTGEKIQAGPIAQSMRMALTSLTELYKLSNEISLLINSHKQVLTSEIAMLSEEIAVLQKTVSNYAFLLADAGAYDISYMEKFNNTLGMSDPLRSYSDRTGIGFQLWEHANVDPVEGVLKISDNIKTPLPNTPILLKSNMEKYMTQSDFLSKVKTKDGDEWRVSIAAPAPITAGLNYEFLSSPSNGGAQMLLEYGMNTPSPIDTIQIEPLTGQRLEILSVIAFEDLAGERRHVIVDDPVTIAYRLSLSFPAMPVAKVWILIRNPVYIKKYNNALQSETLTRQTSTAVGKRTKLNTVSSLYGLQSLSQKHVQEAEESFGINLSGNWLEGIMSEVQTQTQNGSIHSHGIPFSDSKGYGPETMYKAYETGAVDRKQIWSKLTNVSYALFDILKKRFNGTYLDMIVSSPRKEVNEGHIQNADARVDIGMSNNSQTTSMWANMPDQASSYNYELGLKSVRFGTAIVGDRAVWISSPIPSSGDIGEVKIKVEDSNVSLIGTSRENPIVTSVEYSVSNQANPVEEKDWVPIIPSNITTITSERLLPDVMGKAFLRFPASVDAEIKLFKNGYEMTDVSIGDIMIKSSNRQTIVGFSIPQEEMRSWDIFTCSYTPAADYSVVNFKKANLKPAPLTSSFDKDGAGEEFEGTNSELSVELSFDPSISYSDVESSTFNANYGLTPYSPIVVKFNNGDLAYNLTNYKKNEYSTLDADASVYQYIQKGRILLFNKPITETFRVYYQYYPDSVRFRAILRSNTSNYSTPKVDSIQIKGKSLLPDIKRAI